MDEKLLGAYLLDPVKSQNHNGVNNEVKFEVLESPILKLIYSLSFE